MMFSDHLSAKRELGLISSDHNGLLIRRSIKILGHTYQNHGSHDAAFFPPLAKRRTGEGFYVNSGSAIPGHTLLLAHFPCMRYQTWDQGTWRLLPANIVQTLPAGEGLHGRLYLRNHKIHKMYEIQIYGTGYVFQFSVVWWRPFQSFKSLLACTH